MCVCVCLQTSVKHLVLGFYSYELILSSSEAQEMWLLLLLPILQMRNRKPGRESNSRSYRPRNRANHRSVTWAETGVQGNLC